MNVRRAVIVAVAVIVVLAAALVYVRAENERYHVDPEPSEVGLTVGTQLSEDEFPDESPTSRPGCGSTVTPTATTMWTRTT